MIKKHIAYSIILLSIWGWGCYTLLTHPRVGYYKDDRGGTADSLVSASIEEEPVWINDNCLRCHTGRHVAAFYHDPFYDDENPSSMDDPFYVPRRSYSYDPYYERWRSYAAFPWWLSRDDDYLSRNYDDYRGQETRQDWQGSAGSGGRTSSVGSDSAGVTKMERQRLRERIKRLPSGAFRLPTTSSSSSSGGAVSAKRDSVQSVSPSKPAVDDEKEKEEKRSEKRKTWRKGKGLE